MAATAQLTVRNLDDDLVCRLEQRAAADGRSPEEEHRLLLLQALRPEGFADALRAIPTVGDNDDLERIDELPPTPGSDPNRASARHHHLVGASLSVHPPALPVRAVRGKICTVREQSEDLGGLVETRWKRFGHDRVYLEAADGTKVGYVDLVKDELVLDEAEYETAAQDAFARWREVAGRPSGKPAQSPDPEPVVEPEPPTRPEPTTTSRPSLRPKQAELPNLIKAKYDSTCTACGRVVKKGADLFWIPNTSVVVCPSCTAVEVQAGLDTGKAGSAATRKANAGSRKHAERLLKAYPMLGEHLKENARQPAHVRSWIRGADGERVVGRKLDIAAEKGRLIVLHDRLLPSGGNIDHIVIGTRRICVVDAKHYRNAKVTKRKDELCINGEPAEELIDGVRMQKFALQDALADRPLIADNVSAVLAFVGAKFGLTGIITHRGVWCSSVKDAIDFAAHKGPILKRDTMRLTDEERLEIAELLADKFPAN